MEFVRSTSDLDTPGVDAELKIWGRLKEAFDRRDTGVAYHKYPIVDKSGRQFDKEPDFVLLHRELGLIIIECKGFQIDHVDRIDGYVWHLEGVQYNRANPSEQARNQAFHLRSYFDREPKLADDRGRGVVDVSWFVALPNISRDEWEARGFHEAPNTPKVLTSDDLSPKALRKRLFDLDTPRGLTSEQYKAARAVLSGGGSISGARVSTAEEPETKGEFYDLVETGLKRLDEKQEAIGIQIPPGPQQVRGIAGSGKTVLMAMKAARMHARHPDWNIVLTFFTKSLYQHVTELVERFYRQFADDEPNWNNLQILHGWGGRTTLNGFYYKLTLECGARFYTPGSAEELTDDRAPPKVLDACCEELLTTHEIPELYDAILIDEAQDFEQSFYILCRAALAEPKRLIWAYDEAQSLGNLEAPSPINIFGTDEADEPLVDLRGSYEGGIQKSQIMRQAYRSPRQVLMTAHVFGMGLKRSGGAVQAITTKDGWENIGYEVIDGDFRRVGDPVKLTRPAKHSPHPLSDTPEAEPFVDLKTFDSKRQEINVVADRIASEVNDEGLAPDQIIVIPLGDYRHKMEQGNALSEALSNRGVDTHCLWEDVSDEHNVDAASVFRREGRVTISGINRVKGNEGAAIYVLGVEEVANTHRRSGLVQRRNKAFVAITRSRAWCHISGVDQGEGIFRELNTVIDEVDNDRDPVVSFPAPDPQKLEHEMVSEVTTTIDDFVSQSTSDVVDFD